MEEFYNKCGYCGIELDYMDAEIDQFYPKYIFPEMAVNHENLILSCHFCNRYKNVQFPLDENGSPLLLHPKRDNFNDHIKINKDGIAIALTKKGEETIEIFKLNRKSLIEDRKIRKIEDDLVQSYRKGNEEYFKVFQENIQKVRDLNKFSDLAKNDIQRHLLNMLYANAITSLETYLSDAFISTVKSDRNILRKFVETFHDFRQEQFELSELFSYYETIEDKAIKSMLDVIYHDLRKVKGMYKDTLNVEFPDISSLFKAVKMRHDFVHRNGKMKDGNSHKIKAEDVTILCDDIDSFVNNINSQILQIKK